MGSREDARYELSQAVTVELPAAELPPDLAAQLRDEAYPMITDDALRAASLRLQGRREAGVFLDEVATLTSESGAATVSDPAAAPVDRARVIRPAASSRKDLEYPASWPRNGFSQLIWLACKKLFQ